MKIEVETIDRVTKRVAIEVPWDLVKAELDLAYKGLGRRVKVKGFRAGKVPRNVLERMYREAVEREVVQRMVDDSFRKAVEEKELFPINRPVVESTLGLKSGEPLKFAARVEVKPEVEATNYNGLEVVRKIRDITDEEVDKELEGLRQKASTIEPVIGRDTILSRDLATIDFFGFVNGETFKGGKGINYTVEVGGGTMIPGFEDKLLGMKIGEHKEFTLTFPSETGPEEVRGKDVEWKVDLKEIKKKILPDLDDEFAKDLGSFDTLEELRKSIRDNLRTRALARAKRQVQSKVLEKLVESHGIEVPPVMVERQLDFLLEEIRRIAEQNKDPGMTEALRRLREENRGVAAKQVAGMLLLEAVARQEKLEVSEDEVAGRLNEIARENKMSAKQVKATLQKDGRFDSLVYDMRQAKALALLVDKAKITDELISAAEDVDNDEDEDEDHGHGHDHGHDHEHHDHDHEHDHDHDPHQG
ncbi:MAG: trigger factor [Deltaproteobacteria bacterium]|nr:trigger factor [Deltaproteobacteria bacterium]